MLDLFNTKAELFALQEVNWWPRVVWNIADYCDVFISCLDSHSDGTHSLQRIHWWASDAILNFSKFVPMKKQTPIFLEWPEGEYFFSNFLLLYLKKKNLKKAFAV